MASNTNLSVVILAAGKGTRMKSAKPKVLQPLAGKPLLTHVLQTTQKIGAHKVVVVYGHGGELVKQEYSTSNFPIAWALQAEQLGTGHALKMALEHIPAQGKTVVLYGDVPLTQLESIQNLIAKAGNGMAMMTIQLTDPTGYGRIERNAAGEVLRVVEHKDATAEQHKITEINTGVYCVDNACLHRWINQLQNNNAQQEYYLTDIVAMAVAEGLTINTVAPTYSFEVDGVNDRLQLAALERLYQQHTVNEHMRQGLMVIDPQRVDIRGDLSFGSDVTLDINVIIEGTCVLGNNVYVGAGSVLKNVTIGANTIIQPYSLIDSANIGQGASIGPFARIRPGTQLADGVHVGNFVEVKNSVLGANSKANHLTYIGDADIGKSCNIGAGTITCNYDGANKHRTVMLDNVFIGSNNALVAPLHIGQGATTAAGSVITKTVNNNTLAVARAKQVEITTYQRPVKTTSKKD